MKVLIAPLNWGIGHATRSIPLIEHHLNKGNTVIIASSGNALDLLKNRFPTVNNITLPDYRIKYYKKIPVWASICLQGIRILKAIKEEHIFIQKYCIKNKIDLIISDNRYGVYHSGIYSQFICHQLNPLMPLAIVQRPIEYIHRYLCKGFNEILVPDYKDPSNRLSGKLSKTTLKWQSKIKFIGPLSHLNFSTSENKKTTDVFVLLSGIEPQRSILEQLIISQIQGINNSVTIVGGKINDNTIPQGNIRYFSFLNNKRLEQEINNAKYIICRSGYSTIMDLHLLKNKILLFIPTPGQTEQEYLATYLSNKHTNIYMQSQSKLDLKKLIVNVTNNN